MLATTKPGTIHGKCRLNGLKKSLYIAVSGIPRGGAVDAGRGDDEDDAPPCDDTEVLLVAVVVDDVDSVSAGELAASSGGGGRGRGELITVISKSFGVLLLLVAIIGG